MAGTGEPTPGERRWALLRITLGQAQIVAAVIGLVLFATTGASPATFAAVGVALVLVVVSKAVFRDAGQKV